MSPDASSPRLRRGAAALVAALAILGSPGAVRATGQGEWILAGTPEYAAQRVAGETHHGAGAHLDVAYGLTDSVGLQLTGRYAWQAGVGGDGVGPVQVGSLALGARFTLDVLQAIPFLTLTVGAAALHESGGDPALRWNAELALGFGVDWLVRRSFSVGFELRYALLVPDARRFPFAFTLGVRLAWRRD